MKIIIVGGGNVGYYLSRSLLKNHHEILLVEKEKEKCMYVADRLDISVIHGDGTLLRTLEKAKASTADILVAITGNDQDNFVTAQLAKHYFQIKNVIVKANNPKNIDVLKTLAADIVVSSINIISGLIEQEVDAVSMRFITRINMGDSSIVEFIVDNNDALVGKCLSEIEFPPDTLVITIQRLGKTIIPTGDTVLLQGDDVMIATHEKNKKLLAKMFKNES